MAGDDVTQDYEIYDFVEGDIVLHQVYVPYEDTREHRELGMGCWCRPSETRYQGMRVIVHRSWDWREFVAAEIIFEEFLVDGKHMVGYTTCVDS